MSSPTVSEPAIEVGDLWVRYRIPKGRIRSFKEYMIRKLTRSLSYDEFWALRGVSFQVAKGEILGVIGRNGAGKSTLLKVLARVLEPTRGWVVVRGRVAPLLGLGAGFQRELTGRENVILNGVLLGRSERELRERLPEIVRFAGLEHFIDAPLRTYSTGMAARLGFAVATDIQPDVLLLDEVLAVGDVAFKARCTERMQCFRDAGATIVIVSHDPRTIEELCDRVLWLERGKIRLLGPAPEVAEEYRRAMGDRGRAGAERRPVAPPLP